MRHYAPCRCESYNSHGRPTLPLWGGLAAELVSIYRYRDLRISLSHATLDAPSPRPARTAINSSTAPPELSLLLHQG